MKIVKRRTTGYGLGKDTTVSGTLGAHAGGGRTTDIDGRGAYVYAVKTSNTSATGSNVKSNGEPSYSLDSTGQQAVAVVPIDTSQAGRTAGTTGVGTPGTGIGKEGDPSPALGRSRSTPAVVTYPLLDTRDDAGDNTRNGLGVGLEDDPAYTLDTRGVSGVVAYVKVHRAQNVDDYESWADKDVVGTVNVFDTGDTRATAVALNAELGPCGCCPVDPAPDSPRYKAAGNAVSVPVTRWAGERLMASIFSTNWG